MTLTETVVPEKMCLVDTTERPNLLHRNYLQVQWKCTSASLKMSKLRPGAKEKFC